MPNKAHHEMNRLAWNAGTIAHNSHKGNQADFLRKGGNTLFSEEAGLLGDIKGQTLLHLQCNSGQDSLSIASHLGARVTGVDISDEAISFARNLSRKSGIEAQFIRSDVYDFFASNQERFRNVFSSYGVLCWLSDLAAWGRGIATCLEAGGRFVLVDFHPALLMLNEEWRLNYDYMGGIPVEFASGISDYVALTGEAAEIETLLPGEQDFVNPNPGVEYIWGLAEVIMGLVDAGLTLIHFAEYNYSNGFRPMPDMRNLGGRRFAAAAHIPQGIPLMFSLIAELKH